MPTCSARTSTRNVRGAIDPAAGTARDEAIARATACEVLVQSCERALFDLRCALGEATDPAEVRAGLRAIELLQEVLEGWREARAVIPAVPVCHDRQHLRHVHGR
jgi:hypothetical protein